MVDRGGLTFYVCVQVPLEPKTGKLQDGKDTVPVTTPLGPAFTMLSGPNEFGIEVVNANGIEVRPRFTDRRHLLLS